MPPLGIGRVLGECSIVSSWWNNGWLLRHTVVVSVREDEPGAARGHPGSTKPSANPSPPSNISRLTGPTRWILVRNSLRVLGYEFGTRQYDKYIQDGARRLYTAHPCLINKGA
jgi:hypothetical protein